MQEVDWLIGYLGHPSLSWCHQSWNCFSGWEDRQITSGQEGFVWSCRFIAGADWGNGEGNEEIGFEWRGLNKFLLFFLNCKRFKNLVRFDGVEQKQTQLEKSITDLNSDHSAELSKLTVLQKQIVEVSLYICIKKMEEISFKSLIINFFLSLQKKSW